MNCIFVFDQVQHAQTFRQNHEQGASIYQLQPPGAVEPSHVGDYALLEGLGQNPLFSVLAQRTRDYWTTPAQNLPERLYSGDLEVIGVVP